jgi:hypothetical protein
MKTVAQKLGWKEGKSGVMVGCPADVAIPEFSKEQAGPSDILLFFLFEEAAVETALDAAIAHYAVGRSLWFAYPKKSGNIKTALDRDTGWEKMVKADLLPVSQISIDENWSALRFRYRHEIKVLARKNDVPGTKR